MKITVYSAKGGAGKTPISVNMALEHEWAIGTNDPISILSIQDGIHENRLIEINPDEEFPNIPDDFDIVFDLGGAISASSSPSIISAVKQSDLIIVPICDDPRSIAGGIITLNELKQFGKRMLVIATKLERTRFEPKRIPIEDTAGFKNIKASLVQSEHGSLTVLPLRFSRAFENIFKTGVSIEAMVREGGIKAYSYRDLAQELCAINDFLHQKNMVGG